MTAVTANPVERGREMALVQRKVRLVHHRTGEFLHMFGPDACPNTTRDVTWAWSGFRQQAAVMADRARAAGQDWPFVIVPLEEDGTDSPFTHPLDRLRR